MHRFDSVIHSTLVNQPIIARRTNKENKPSHSLAISHVTVRGTNLLCTPRGIQHLFHFFVFNSSLLKWKICKFLAEFRRPPAHSGGDWPLRSEFRYSTCMADTKSSIMVVKTETDSSAMETEESVQHVREQSDSDEEDHGTRRRRLFYTADVCTILILQFVLSQNQGCASGTSIKRWYPSGTQARSVSNYSTFLFVHFHKSTSS